MYLPETEWQDKQCMGLNQRLHYLPVSKCTLHTQSISQIALSFSLRIFRVNTV